jgi:hypothetical protein
LYSVGLRAFIFVLSVELSLAKTGRATAHAAPMATFFFWNYNRIIIFIQDLNNNNYNVISIV